MKKLICLMLAALMVLGLAACAKNDTQPPVATDAASAGNNGNAPEPAKPSTLVYGSGDYDSINPIMNEHCEIKHLLFYTQGDYGLWQCSKAYHNRTYDNELLVRQMVARQRDMKIPTELVPYCPVCGAPLTMNLRCDDTFVQDRGWYAASERYADFLGWHKQGKVLYLELGVGNNTPVIIKYPFWRYTLENPDAVYVCINHGQAYAPREIVDRSICLNMDIGHSLTYECIKGYGLMNW